MPPSSQQWCGRARESLTSRFNRATVPRIFGDASTPVRRGRSGSICTVATTSRWSVAAHSGAFRSASSAAPAPTLFSIHRASPGKETRRISMMSAPSPEFATTPTASTTGNSARRCRPSTDARGASRTETSLPRKRTAARRSSQSPASAAVTAWDWCRASASRATTTASARFPTRAR